MKDQRLPGFGPTPNLSLRVSVATLARVIFPNPKDGEPLLALEHKATLVPGLEKPQVMVKAQPFGGAVRIRNVKPLLMLADGFQFDSERSRSERDFRVFIRPADWQAVRAYCLRQFDQADKPDLEIDPTRELEEEFMDAMGTELRQDQYTLKPAGTVIENEPLPSGNVHAIGAPTVRIYRLFAVHIRDPALRQAMLANSEGRPSSVLHKLALDDAGDGGPGRANALFAAPLRLIWAAFGALPQAARRQPLPFKDTLLDGNVAAILEGLTESNS